MVQRVVLSRLLRRLEYLLMRSGLRLGRFATYALFLGGTVYWAAVAGGEPELSGGVWRGGGGWSVGLGLQNVVSNFVAGLVLLVEQPIRIGDRVATKDTLGDVVKIAARSTWIRTNDNVVIIVPNGEFINNSVTNWTANDPNVRINLPVGVGYGSDPEQVRELMLAAASVRISDVLEGAEVRM